MSDFIITGNANPVVGKEEFYSIEDPLTLLFPKTSEAKSPFDEPVLWTVHVLEYGRWRKTKENDKVGDKVSYTFLQRSLDREGIRILARKGDQIARLDIKTQFADKPKINNIELLDKSGKKPDSPLSYGQTLKTRVHCLHMERREVFVTLWEDDAKGTGDNKENEKNIIETRSGIVKEGIVEIDFLLKPSFAKIVKKDGAEKEKMHEYYVTTNFNNENLASNILNVQELDEPPVKPFKGKTSPPPQQTVKPKAQPSDTSTTTKSEITKVHITDIADRVIKGIFKEKQLKVWVESKELIGKEVRLKLYDHDSGSPNDLLADIKFAIKSNVHAMVIPLNKISRSLGGNFFQEGAEQELFAHVEVLQSNKSLVSEIVQVDAKVFKQDEREIVNAVMTVFTPDKKEEKKEEEGTCPNCDKDITLDEIKKICVDNKGHCLIDDETMIKAALPYLNKYRKKVDINTCVRKAHFLAQISQESKFYDLEEGFNYYWKSLISTFGAFTTVDGKNKAKLWGREIKDKNAKGYKSVTAANEINIANWAYKDNNSNKGFASEDGSKYRGRGFKQITWKSNYKDLSVYFNKKMKIDNEANINWEENYLDLSNKSKDAIISALAFWGKNNINTLANDNDVKAVEKVTKKINTALKGLEERKKFFKNAVTVLKVDDCKKGTELGTEDGTVIIVSGTDTKKEKDPTQDIYWVMYKTSVYKDMSLEKYKKLQTSKKLPEPDFITYLSRDTHQTYSKKQGSFTHSDKRFGQYNEIPPGEYFLVLALPGQTYKVYVVDSESKAASAENGIDGLDGARGGVALHHYCPRFSVGCFTFNSGTDTAPVTSFIKQIPDLKLKDERPVRFLVEARKVTESIWDDPEKGTKKWTGI